MALQSSVSTKYSLLKIESHNSVIRRKLIVQNIVVIFIVLLLFLVFFFLFNFYYIYTIDANDNHDVTRAKLYATEEYFHHTMVSEIPQHTEGAYYNAQKKLICYYTAPSPIDNSHDLQPEVLIPDLCTHINVGFAHVESNAVAFSDSFNDTLKRVLTYKKVNSDLKVLLSIGGAGENSGFPKMALTHASRKEFIKSVKNVLSSHDLDGIDLDWEFPAISTKYSVFDHLRIPQDDNFFGMEDKRQRQHFTQLLREIRREFSREKRDYLLSVAVAAPQSIIKAAYDVPEINRYVDYVNVMTYDYHYYNAYSPLTGLNSPLYGKSTELFYMKTLNVNYSANYWINQGMERRKIILGIPTYGHSFHLRNPDNHDIGSPSSGYGHLGINGFVNYSEICLFLNNNNFLTQKVFDRDTHCPYFYIGNEWVSFENQASVTAKAQYIKDNNFGGAMIYSLNSDDIQGVCELSNTKFSLTRQVKKIIFEADL